MKWFRRIEGGVMLPFNIVIARKPGPVMDPVWWSADAMKLEGKVCSALYTGGELQDVRETTNLITDDGDLFYAYFGELIRTKTATSVPTAYFVDATGGFDGVMQVYTGTNSPTKSSTWDDLAPSNLVTVDGSITEQTIESGFPKRNDTTSANTGGAVDAITYKYRYVEGELAADNMDGVAIMNPTPGVSNDKLLMWASNLNRSKTTNDELDIYVNHLMDGASS